MKKVSIIMPVYNTEKYVADSIESVLKQTYPNIELIIIDDKSTDDSLKIITEYAERYDNVRLIANAKNSLVGYSRNIGILNATGDYIAFIDSDDMYTPDYVEKLVNALEENDVDISMCKYRQFVGKRCTAKDNSSGKVKVIDVVDDPVFLEKARGCCWNKLYRRHIFDTVQFATDITFEDVSFCYPSMVLARKIAFVDAELYQYRRNANSITITNKRIPQKGILDLYYASCELDANYRLVKSDDVLNKTMRDISHSVLYISALDAACWIQMPRKDYKRIVNLFAFLANRKYNLTIAENGYMQRAKKERLIYFLRLILLNLVLDKDFFTSKTDEEILSEIEEIIDNYLVREQVKSVKKKKK